MAPAAPLTIMRRTSRRGGRIFDVVLAVGMTVVIGFAGAIGHGAAPSHIDIHEIGGRLIWLGVAVAATLPLALRRPFPLVVFGLTGGAALTAMIIFGSPGLAAVGPLIALYTVATVCPRPISLTACWVALCGAVVGVSVERVADLAWEAFAFPAVVIVTAWLVGDNLRVRRAYVAQLEERAARAEADRVAGAERAAASERARIARELHDVVAHHVSVIAIQAGAARMVSERLSPGDGVGAGAESTHPEALVSIESTARQALTELRRLLGVLRHDGDGDAPSLAPQPSIRSLDELFDGVRRAGLPLESRIEGDVVPLAPSIELSAYRIVQEALTNVLKHEGAVPTEVTLRYGEHDLEIAVIDKPTGVARASALGGGGHGLAGMRERVALFGGDLCFGPRADGAFEVLVRLPFDVGRK
jgi:signal transduction histidine kinase